MIKAKIRVSGIVWLVAMCVLMFSCTDRGTNSTNIRNNGPKPSDNGTVSKKEVLFSLSHINKLELKGNFSHPKYSPDGRRILLTQPDGTGLYYIDTKKDPAIDNTKVVKLNAVPQAGMDACWSADSKEVLYYDNTDGAIKRHGINSFDINPVSDISRIGMGWYATSDGQETILNRDSNTGHVTVSNLTNGMTTQILTTNDEHIRIIPSPDRKMVLAQTGNGSDVYWVDGSGIIADLKSFVGTCWSIDSSYILGFMRGSNNSDLYVYSIAEAVLKQITNTNDVSEVWPSWSSAGNAIVYRDEISRSVIVADLEIITE